MNSKYIVAAKWALILLTTTFIVISVTSIGIALFISLFFAYEYSFRAAREVIKKSVKKNKNLGMEVGFYTALFAILPCLLLSLFNNPYYLSYIILILLGLIGGKRADKNTSSISI